MKAQQQRRPSTARIFPGPSPLMHVIAAKAVASRRRWVTFKESPGIRNAQIVAQTLTERGLRINSTGPEEGEDLRAKVGITGKGPRPCWAVPHDYQQERHPNDPESRWSPACASVRRRPTRGFKDEEARLTANLIADVLWTTRATKPTSPRSGPR